MEQAKGEGRLDVRLQTEVAATGERDVPLVGQGSESRLPTDGVIVQAGGVLPHEQLRAIGVDVETRHGTA